MDGVVTRTARLHAAAWKVLSDEVLECEAARSRRPFHPFDVQPDYFAYVDGVPRYEGVRRFLPFYLHACPDAARSLLLYRHHTLPRQGALRGDAAMNPFPSVADAASDAGVTATARYADELHHEYRGQLDALVRRALPQCSPEQCRCIAAVALCRGDVTSELLELIEARRISLLAIGWQGRFMTGRARVLKRLIERVSCPALLVKPTPRAPFRLEVGAELE